MTPPPAEAQAPQGATGHAASGEAAAGASPVDPEVLAERVYELMRAELRLERIRGGGGSRLKE